MRRSFLLFGPLRSAANEGSDGTTGKTTDPETPPVTEAEAAVSGEPADPAVENLAAIVSDEAGTPPPEGEAVIEADAVTEAATTADVDEGEEGDEDDDDEDDEGDDEDEGDALVEGEPEVPAVEDGEGGTNLPE